MGASAFGVDEAKGRAVKLLSAVIYGKGHKADL